MVDVEQDKLVLACEGAIQYGVGHPVLLRTLELYENQTVYCFEEPRNSMEKALREKVYLHGCRVVDCGMVGLTEVLALFLWDYEYLERVDRLGNRCGLEFRPAIPRAFFSSTWSSAMSPVATLVQQVARRCLDGADGPPTSVPSVALVPSMMDGAGGPHASGSSEIDDDDDRAVGGFESRSVLSSSGSAERLPPDEESWAEFCRGDYMVLLYLPSKALKWSWLKAVRRLSGTYDTPDSEELASPGIEAGDGGPRESALVRDAGEEEDVREEGGGRSEATAAKMRRRAAERAAQGRLRRSPLYASLSEATNQVCADCGSPHPTWCVLQPFGVFTCIDCIGVHRQLWANKCREVELDHWPAEDVAYMQRRGNAIANAELEYGLRGITHGSLKEVKPTPSSPIFDRENYIYQKYVERQFCRENTEETPFLLVTEMEQSGIAANSPSGGARQDLKTPCSSSRPRRLGGATSTTGASPVTSAATAGHGLLSFPALGPTPFPEQMGPPRYSGVVIVVVEALSAYFPPPVSRGVLPYLREGLVCVLTNGYQELRTQWATRPVERRDRQRRWLGEGSRSRPDDDVVRRPYPAACWNETMQLGVEDVSQPLCLSIFTCRRRKRRLLAAGEFFLDKRMIQAESEVEGKKGKKRTTTSLVAQHQRDDDDSSNIHNNNNNDDDEDDDLEGEERSEGGPSMEPVTVRLRWCHLNHPLRPRPYDTWTVSLLATYCSYA